MTSIRLIAVPLALACAWMPMLHAQEIARLYKPQPPAGSAYVRVVNPSHAVVAITLGGSMAQRIGAGAQASTSYQVINATQKLVLGIDGRAVTPDVKPAAGSFVTLVLGRKDGTFTFKALTDGTDGRDDLKAELRFYNLATGCAGAVTLADGRAVFDNVAGGDSRRRAINPVQAGLVGRCGAAASPTLALPQLKSGDHYSLFLVGDAAAVELLGQFDRTEP